LELCRRYGAFVVTDVPKMSFREKDLARRFIVFIDAVYESKVPPPPADARLGMCVCWFGRGLMWVGEDCVDVGGSYRRDLYRR
jgi:hypothetical protein